MTEPRIPIALRTQALEELLVERGLVDPAVMDTFIKMYETDIGPLNGAKVVAKAWTDPEYKARLLADGTAAVAELGFKGSQGEHIDDVEIEVWDSSSEVRYFVLPERPSGTAELAEEDLVPLVTRDAMVGVAKVAAS